MGGAICDNIADLSSQEDEAVQKLDEEWVNRPPQAAPWTDCREQMCLLKRFAGVCLQEDTDFLLGLVIRRLEQNFTSIYRIRY